MCFIVNTSYKVYYEEEILYSNYYALFINDCFSRM